MTHAKHCNAKTKAGTPCKRPAGWGTPHVGEGRCKLHGGCSLRGLEHPNFTNGTHSKYFSPSDLVGYDEWRATVGYALQLEDDILAMMFVVREMLLRQEPAMVMTRGGPVPFPVDADYISRCMERMARAAEKLWQHREGMTVNVRISSDEVRALLDIIGRALAKHVTDDAQVEAVMAEIEDASKAAFEALKDG